MTSPTTRKKILIWVGLFVVIVSVRVNHWNRSPIIKYDGVGFIRWAKQANTNPITLLKSTYQEPAFPILLNLTFRSLQIFHLDEIRRWEYSGILLSIIASCIIAAATYIIGKEIFNKNVGYISAFFISLTPLLVQMSANVMTEPTFLAFLSLSIAMFLLARKQGTAYSLTMPLLAGVFMVLAFLTRKEGLAILPAFLLFLLLPKIEMTTKKRFVVGIILLASVTAGAGTFRLATGPIKWMDYYWKVWHVRKFAEVSVPTKNFVTAKTLRTKKDLVWEPVHRTIKLTTWTLVLAAMLYPFVRKHYHTKKSLWILIFTMSIYIGIMYIHGLGHGYIIGRYLLPATLAIIPISSAVIMKLAKYSSRQTVQILIILLFALPSLISDIAVKPSSSIGIVSAGKWMNENTPKNSMLFVRDIRLGFYSNRRWTRLAGHRDFLRSIPQRYLKDNRPGYVLITSKNKTPFDRWKMLIEKAIPAYKITPLREMLTNKYRITIGEISKKNE